MWESDTWTCVGIPGIPAWCLPVTAGRMIDGFVHLSHALYFNAHASKGGWSIWVLEQIEGCRMLLPVQAKQHPFQSTRDGFLTLKGFVKEQSRLLCKGGQARSQGWQPGWQGSAPTLRVQSHTTWKKPAEKGFSGKIQLTAQRWPEKSVVKRQAWDQAGKFKSGRQGKNAMPGTAHSCHSSGYSKVLSVIAAPQLMFGRLHGWRSQMRLPTAVFHNFTVFMALRSKLA